MFGKVQFDLRAALYGKSVQFAVNGCQGIDSTASSSLRIVSHAIGEQDAIRDPALSDFLWRFPATFETLFADYF